MVGYELLAETQRDLAPEDAAERLREVVPANVPAEARVEVSPPTA
jgi:galactose-1-phosphate uridylyltransferase